MSPLSVRKSWCHGQGDKARALRRPCWTGRFWLLVDQLPSEAFLSSQNLPVGEGALAKLIMWDRTGSSRYAGATKSFRRQDGRAGLCQNGWALPQASLHAPVVVSFCHPTLGQTSSCCTAGRRLSPSLAVPRLTRCRAGADCMNWIKAVLHQHLRSEKEEKSKSYKF